METCFNYCYKKYQNDNVAFFSSDEQKWITKMRKLASEHPDEITILKQPEDNDGTIYCRLPQSWLRVNPPRVLSEELKQTLSDRMKALNAEQQQQP